MFENFFSVKLKVFLFKTEQKKLSCFSRCYAKKLKKNFEYEFFFGSKIRENTRFSFWYGQIMAFGGLFWEAGNYSAAIRIIEYKGRYSDGRAIFKKNWRLRRASSLCFKKIFSLIYCSGEFKNNLQPWISSCSR